MASDTDRVWELMEKISICMLTTHDGERIRSRPMAAFVRRDEDAMISSAMRTIRRMRKFREPECRARVRRRAEVRLGHRPRGGFRDKAKIKEVWGPAAKAWWDSPDDPNIRLLTVKPDDAEFSDGPGKIIGTIKMVAAAATSSRPNYGENRKVAM